MYEICERVVCAIDDSEAGETAAKLAAKLTLADGHLTLVSVEAAPVVVSAAIPMAAASRQLGAEARAALERGRELAGRDHRLTTRLLEGNPIGSLLTEVERRQATLLVVGSHGYSRPAGIALGSVATNMLHKAPCPVLIARAPSNGERWPRSIVVGLDGSAGSGLALRAARALAERFGASLRQVVATADHPDLEAARSIVPDVEELPGKAVDELTVLSEFTDLVVLGSRGLKGVRALGSVSERVAHRAKCPVLVVRGV